MLSCTFVKRQLVYSLCIRRVETQKCTITKGKMTNWVGQDAGHGHGMESNFTNAFTRTHSHDPFTVNEMSIGSFHRMT